MLQTNRAARATIDRAIPAFPDSHALGFLPVTAQVWNGAQLDGTVFLF
jgi:hypothetical protein